MFASSTIIYIESNIDSSGWFFFINQKNFPRNSYEFGRQRYTPAIIWHVARLPKSADSSPRGMIIRSFWIRVDPAKIS